MNNHRTRATVLQGLLADEIRAVIQYFKYSATRDNSNHAELHKALLEMHEEFPKWREQRVAIRERESREQPTKRESE